LQNLSQSSGVVTSQKHFASVSCSGDKRHFSEAKKFFAELQSLTHNLLRTYLARFEQTKVLPK